MNIRHITATLLLALAATASAQEEDKWTQWGPTRGLTGMGVIARAGYTIGGTTPLPLPAEIRHIGGFRPKGGATVGADVYKMLSRRWGISGGWNVFYEGFHTKADVKNYRMSLTQEGNTMSGNFTGADVTDTYMFGMSQAILATFRMSPRWNVSLGPYLATYFKKSFKGEVYDNSHGVGYLRVDDPTGEKININRENPATYDFTDNMYSWNGGLELCFDWKALRHMNVFGRLDWGLSNIWEHDFDAVAFRMYPIYGTIGLAYRY